MAGAATIGQLLFLFALHKQDLSLIKCLTKVFQLLFDRYKAVTTMKRKMILPLLAFAFAVVSAFAALPVQMAYFKPVSGPVTTGTITTPPSNSGITCVEGAANICKVGTRDAYVSAEAAAAGTADGLLRYDN